MKSAYPSTALFVLALFAGGPAAADALKDEAVARLAASHDPDIPLAIGRIVVKQAGLKAIGAVLAQRGRAAGLDAGWNPAAPEWEAAQQQLTQIVDGIIARRIDDPEWLRKAWARETARVLDAEEADEIASHFATEGGREQRIVIELLLVGETLLANYTFTDRLDSRIKGLEREVAQLQKIWWDREPFRVRNFDGHPGAIKFAGQNPGVKYVKMVVIQGVEAVTTHFDRVAKETAQTVTQAAGEIDPFIEAYRSRRAVESN